MSIKYARVTRLNHKTNVKQIYAQAVSTTTSQDTMARLIAAKTTLTKPDVVGVVQALQEFIIDEFIEGRGVKLDLLGTFYPTLVSEGVDEADQLSAAQIRAIRIRFRPIREMEKDVASRATFAVSATKKAASKALKEEAETVDRRAADSREAADDDDEQG